jgi:hypothetical protein
MPDVQVRVESRRKAPEEFGLGGVPHRIGTWVRTNADVESHDRPKSDEFSNARAGHKPALQPHDLRGRPTRPLPDEAQRQASADSCGAKVFSKSYQVAVSNAPGPIHRSLSSRHQMSLAKPAWLALNRLWSES